MNARPFSALAIATIPDARGPIQEGQLYELLSGADAYPPTGRRCPYGRAYTTEGSDLALGFAVTGFAEEDRLFQKSKLKPGDRLILTKPLGSGALLAAWMRGECRADWFEPLIAGMILSNGPASVIFRDAGVAACTDVTGFGLAGHLLEMLDASRVSARLTTKAVRLYQGFDEVVSKGVVSSLHAGNARAGRRVQGTAAAWLFDPQTSGGLLAAVSAASRRPDVRRPSSSWLSGCGRDRRNRADASRRGAGDQSSLSGIGSSSQSASCGPGRSNLRPSAPRRANPMIHRTTAAASSGPAGRSSGSRCHWSGLPSSRTKLPESRPATPRREAAFRSGSQRGTIPRVSSPPRKWRATPANRSCPLWSTRR